MPTWLAVILGNIGAINSNISERNNSMQEFRDRLSKIQKENKVNWKRYRLFTICRFALTAIAQQPLGHPYQTEFLFVWNAPITIGWMV